MIDSDNLRFVGLNEPALESPGLKFFLILISCPQALNHGPQSPTSNERKKQDAVGK